MGFASPDMSIPGIDVMAEPLGVPIPISDIGSGLFGVDTDGTTDAGGIAIADMLFIAPMPLPVAGLGLAIFVALARVTTRLGALRGAVLLAAGLLAVGFLAGAGMVMPFMSMPDIDWAELAAGKASAIQAASATASRLMPRLPVVAR